MAITDCRSWEHLPEQESQALEQPGPPSQALEWPGQASRERPGRQVPGSGSERVWLRQALEWPGPGRLELGRQGSP